MKKKVGIGVGIKRIDAGIQDFTKSCFQRRIRIDSIRRSTLVFYLNAVARKSSSSGSQFDLVQLEGVVHVVWFVTSFPGRATCLVSLVLLAVLGGFDWFPWFSWILFGFSLNFNFLNWFLILLNS